MRRSREESQPHVHCPCHSCLSVTAGCSCDLCVYLQGFWRGWRTCLNNRNPDTPRRFPHSSGLAPACPRAQNEIQMRHVSLARKQNRPRSWNYFKLSASHCSHGEFSEEFIPQATSIFLPGKTWAEWAHSARMSLQFSHNSDNISIQSKLTLSRAGFSKCFIQDFKSVF